MDKCSHSARCALETILLISSKVSLQRDARALILIVMLYLRSYIPTVAKKKNKPMTASDKSPNCYSKISVVFQVPTSVASFWEVPQQPLRI